MYEILKNLYLGNRNDIIESSDNFDLLVNCTFDLPFYSNNKNTNKIRIPLKNDCNIVSYDIITNNITNIINLIDLNINNNKKVLIFCKYGEQRSPTIICMYLSYKYNWPILKSVEYVKFKSENAFRYGINYIDYLDKWYNTAILKCNKNNLKDI